MKRETKDRLFSFLPLILSIAAWPLSCTLWGGIVCAGAAVVLVFIHNRFFEGNRIVITAFIISLIYLAIWILYLIFAGIYRGVIMRNMKILEEMR